MNKFGLQGCNIFSLRSKQNFVLQLDRFLKFVVCVFCVKNKKLIKKKLKMFDPKSTKKLRKLLSLLRELKFFAKVNTNFKK